MAAYLMMLGVFALNVLVPGASFVLVLTHAMAHGRRTGILVALGLVTVDVVFACAATGGIAVVLSHHSIWVRAFGLLGGGWFVFSGLRLVLKGKKTNVRVNGTQSEASLTGWSAYRQGLAGGACNVQVIIFFSTIILASIAMKPTLAQSAIMVAGIAVVSAVLRCGIVQLFTSATMASIYANRKRMVETLSGGALAAFGLKLLGTSTIALLGMHLLAT